jgi:hypothetical protein
MLKLNMSEASEEVEEEEELHGQAFQCVQPHSVISC